MIRALIISGWLLQRSSWPSITTLRPPHLHLEVFFQSSPHVSQNLLSLNFQALHGLALPAIIHISHPLLAEGLLSPSETPPFPPRCPPLHMTTLSLTERIKLLSNSCFFPIPPIFQGQMLLCSGSQVLPHPGVSFKRKLPSCQCSNPIANHTSFFQTILFWGGGGVRFETVQKHHSPCFFNSFLKYLKLWLSWESVFHHSTEIPCLGLLMPKLTLSFHSGALCGGFSLLTSAFAQKEEIHLHHLFNSMLHFAHQATFLIPQVLQQAFKNNNLLLVANLPITLGESLSGCCSP